MYLPLIALTYLVNGHFVKCWPDWPRSVIFTTVIHIFLLFSECYLFCLFCYFRELIFISPLPFLSLQKGSHNVHFCLPQVSSTHTHSNPAMFNFQWYSCHVTYVFSDSWCFEADMSKTSTVNWNDSWVWSPEGQWVSSWMVQEVQVLVLFLKIDCPTNFDALWWKSTWWFINLSLVIIGTYFLTLLFVE